MSEGQFTEVSEPVVIGTYYMTLLFGPHGRLHWLFKGTINLSRSKRKEGQLPVVLPPTSSSQLVCPFPNAVLTDKYEVKASASPLAVWGGTYGTPEAR